MFGQAISSAQFCGLTEPAVEAGDAAAKHLFRDLQDLALAGVGIIGGGGNALLPDRPDRFIGEQDCGLVLLGREFAESAAHFAARALRRHGRFPRSFKVSPMQISGISPCRTAASTLRPTVLVGFRRNARAASEWPSSTRSRLQSFSIGGEISPVQAPLSSQCMFWAPTLIEVAARISFTCRTAVKGGMMKALYARIAGRLRARPPPWRRPSPPPASCASSSWCRSKPPDRSRHSFSGSARFDAKIPSARCRYAAPRTPPIPQSARPPGGRSARAP